MNCDLVIEVTKTVPMDDDATMEVQTTQYVRIVLDAPVSGRDWCHVCLSEGVQVRSDRCDDALHEQTGTIVMDVRA